MTFATYGITEMMQGNGFVAVFTAAVMLRATDRKHGFHSHLEGFSEQVERLLMVVVMIIFGGTLAAGGLYALTWTDVAVGLTILLIIRPVAAGLSLVGIDMPWAARGLICFFGIRGIGTLYYIAYASSRGTFPNMDQAVALTSFVVLASVVLHGVSSGPVMLWVDARREKRTRQARSSA
jgi:sodium/hydrogen antiporter